MRNLFLVAYDIAHPKRLRKVFKKMQGYGTHLQYSVFTCELSPVEKARMVADLHRLIHHEEDRILIANLGPADGRGRRSFQFLGRSTPPPEPGPAIL